MGDREDCNSTKLALNDVLKKNKKNTKTPQRKGASLSEVFTYSKEVVFCLTLMRSVHFYTIASLKIYNMSKHLKVRFLSIILKTF